MSAVVRVVEPPTIVLIDGRRFVHWSLTDGRGAFAMQPEVLDALIWQLNEEARDRNPDGFLRLRWVLPWVLIGAFMQALAEAANRRPLTPTWLTSLALGLVGASLFGLGCFLTRRRLRAAARAAS